ncbi:hypothetical protein IF1G_07306 [Cordyceps javanica]|uniref:Uncharacterized protein n=1 Tax=Cordyceps javanica TaxID=43265 RepID=A0A545UYB1_9HYPO|nr:hypothetical protein IF1G_07306 [Cordyceps javanica]
MNITRLLDWTKTIALEHASGSTGSALSSGQLPHVGLANYSGVGFMYQRERRQVFPCFGLRCEHVGEVEKQLWQ